jgi:CBS domain-containing membrane protein
VNKWKGQHHHPALGVNYKFALMSSFGGFVGMTAVSTLHDSLFRQAENQYYFLIASFAAVATVIFALPASPYAQPRTVMGAHLICCVSGLLVNYFMTEGLSTYFLPRAVGLALVPAISIGLMQRFGYTCPPAAATGIIFLMDNDVRNLGWWYILFPCISGCAVLIFLGLVINNMSKSRVYPVFW